ncbi:hypothetical protein [Pelotomaculum propionicicum]|mgnify:CR=1 FL=1|uniref:DUF2953 domain-containing protein n=1 Tax=Pelotomaculum propionicicum TaxID=258475 RepID=A0A4Y7RXV8_9FIRM|nr:hypothetical protein [Pelotomaculum propionicicum]NLI12710.1 hypothetical protein [Peptococcaceae bacterium]TEB13502.1 hypothetical protein Pmgp_00396 [Pelotomaculum propionicicum]
MNILIVSLCVIILLPLAVLMAPLSFQAQVSLGEKAAGMGRLDWAGGLLTASFVFENSKPDFCVRFVTWEKRLQKTGDQSRRIKRNRPKKANRRLSTGYIIQFIDIRLLKEVCRFLNSFQRSLNLSLAGEYGAGDPALTGFIAGILAALNNSRNLRLHPNFSETTLNLQGEIRGRLIPAALICHFLVFLLAASVRKIWWPALKQKFTIKGVC